MSCDCQLLSKVSQSQSGYLHNLVVLYCEAVQDVSKCGIDFSSSATLDRYLGEGILLGYISSTLDDL